MTFWATLVTLTNQLISADFNQLISYFPSDLGIFNQNYNMGHFSHSILVTEPDSVIRITKFQEFWIFWNLWNLSANKQKFCQKILEFLEFCDSDYRIRFSDEN